MNIELGKYFEKDEDAFYKNKHGEKCFKGIDYPDNTRKDKAIKEAKKSPVSYSKIFCYVNEFLELLRADNKVGCRENTKIDFIQLDDTQQIIVDNGIIVKNLDWKDCIYSTSEKKYTYWDPKYNDIKQKFNLKYANDIIWLKFTKKGFLGVVAKSFDINFRDDSTSGKLVAEVGDKWDKSFVFIFPLTKDILGSFTKDQVELGIGKYLSSKGVPIIDFYSHNN